jgi:hypothetical protein
MYIMEEHKSTAGQGLGIAGLVMGILAIPMGIFPCTFYIGIIFGIIGIVLSVVALSQANRGYGPKALIIAALVCSIIGLTFASVWGFTLSHNGARFIREVMHNGIRNESFDDFRRGTGGNMRDMESDTASFQDHSSGDMKHMTDTLKMLEGESKNP